MEGIDRYQFLIKRDERKIPQVAGNPPRCNWNPEITMKKFNLLPEVISIYFV
jgi:hypothetical protein